MGHDGHMRLKAPRLFGNPRLLFFHTMKKLIPTLSALLLASCASSMETFRTEKNPLEPALHAAECLLRDEGAALTRIKGTTHPQMLACMGYAHARDRGGQMDYFRRVAWGRASEVYGSGKLRSDLGLRLLALGEHAERLWRELDSERKELLWAYAWGVNLGFKRFPKQWEFEKWGYLPEDWHPADSLAVLMLQSLDQTRKTFEQDLTESQRISDWGATAERRFSPARAPWDTSILKEGEYERAERATSSAPSRGGHSAATWFREWGEIFPATDTGSNNWVLSGARSKSGRAWFANDPHLDLKNPPFWYWISLESPEVRAMGATLPGVPFIVSGANERLSWGLTNAYLDVGDLVLVDEKELEGKTTPFRPHVKFKWAGLTLPFFFKSFERVTAGGEPVMPIDAPEGKKFVLRWSGHRLQAKDIAPAFDLWSQKSVDEMETLIRGFGLPSWNLVFADTAGKIGYRATGRIPRRTSAPYGTPEIALADLEVKEWMSPDEVPHVTHPRRGFVVTANNRHFPEGSKLWTSRSNSMGFRGFRIEEMMLEVGKHDLASQKRIQCDAQAPDARFILPELLKRLGEEPLEPALAEAVQGLKSWNYDTGLECKPCGLYRMWVELLGAHLRMNENAFWNALLDGELDAERKAEFTALFREKLKEAHALVAHAKTWGELHQSHFTTFLGDRESTTSLPTHGDTHSVSPGTSTWNPKLKRFVHTAGASQRVLIEMSQPPRVHRMLAGANKSVKDPDFSAGSIWTRWRDCEYEQISWNVNWNSAQRVTLAR